ncbi:membrane protein [Streptomyces badius]
MDATERVSPAGSVPVDAAPSGTGRRGGRFVGLALACHPGPALAVTALTCALALGSGLGGPRSALVTAAVLTGQLSGGLVQRRVRRAA